jgi:mRNA-degrading endonuclease toxin of MazEF toxin-antitoxin module
LHVTLTDNCPLTGVIMVDQIKSVDYTARQAKFIEKAPADIINEALSILDAIIYDE